MVKIVLTEKHCDEVLNRELVIGTDKTFNNLRKSFIYNPYYGDFIIYRDGVKHSSGKHQVMQNLLDTYNDL